MNKIFAKYLKKNVVLIVSVAVCGCVLFLCSAGSDSSGMANISQPADVNNSQNKNVNPTSGFLSDNTGFTGSSPLKGTELFYKTMLAVLLVAALGTAAIVITKKYLPKIANLQGKEIRVIETVHLGPRKSVHLLEIGSRKLLIGSTNENISKLADLTDFSSNLSLKENELE